jgi:hypothetical protein
VAETKNDTEKYTDVQWCGGPAGGQHARVFDDLESSVDHHGGTYRLRDSGQGTAKYIWDADPDRPVAYPTDGDEASAAMGEGTGDVVVDRTAGVATDGPSISPAVKVTGSGSSKPSSADERDAAKTGGARPAGAPAAPASKPAGRTASK